MQTGRRATGVIAASIALGFIGAIPAHAEGGRTTYISGWHINNESSRWTDNATDSNRTTVQFSGCSTDSENGFNDAGITLYEDVFGPDKDRGTRTNRCNTSSWAAQEQGKYYFTLSSLTYGGTLNVKKVQINY